MDRFDKGKKECKVNKNNFGKSRSPATVFVLKAKGGVKALGIDTSSYRHFNIRKIKNRIIRKIYVSLAEKLRR